MRRILILAGAAALAIVASGCAGGGAQATATPAAKAVASPTITRAAAMTTPATSPTAATGAATATGSADAGKALIVSKGCSSCHTVPGVPEAKGTTGPNLGGFAGHAQIAGTLPNNPDNLTKWLKNPPGVKPGTAMPNLNLSDKEIADLEAFLYTLK